MMTECSANPGSIAQLSLLTLNGPLHVTHFQRAVVYRFAEQKKRDQEQADVGNEHSTVILCIGHGTIGNAQSDSQENQSAEEQEIAPLAAEICTNRRNLTTVWAPGQVVLQCVEQERIVTVTAGNAAHAGHRQQRWRHRTRRQVDDAFAVGPRARHPLGRALADQQTIAGAADILFARRSISNWRSLIAL